MIHFSAFKVRRCLNPIITILPTLISLSINIFRHSPRPNTKRKNTFINQWKECHPNPGSHCFRDYWQQQRDRRRPMCASWTQAARCWRRATCHHSAVFSCCRAVARDRRPGRTRSEHGRWRAPQRWSRARVPRCTGSGRSPPASWTANKITIHISSW